MWSYLINHKDYSLCHASSNFDHCSWHGIDLPCSIMSLIKCICVRSIYQLTLLHPLWSIISRTVWGWGKPGHVSTNSGYRLWNHRIWKATANHTFLLIQPWLDSNPYVALENCALPLSYCHVKINLSRLISPLWWASWVVTRADGSSRVK